MKKSLILFLTLTCLIFYEKMEGQDLLQSDYDALIAIYEATNDEGWHNEANWDINDPVSDWGWVTLSQDGERVIGLNLSSNNLTGDLPLDINDLTALQWIYMSNNSITGLPDLSTLINLYTLDLTLNLLSFEDLEPLIPHPNFNPVLSIKAFGFGFVPQRYQPEIDGPKTVIYPDGFTLTVPQDGINTQYLWTRSNVPVEDNDDNPLTYTIASALFQDRGNYIVKLTHPAFPHLTINSLPLVLPVTGIDAQGGTYIPDQIVVLLEMEPPPGNPPHLEYGANLLRTCPCNPLIQIWEFPNLPDAPAVIPSDLGDVFTHDINEIKDQTNQNAGDDPCIDSVGFNYYTDFDLLENFVIAPPVSTTPNAATPLKVAIIDTGIKGSELTGFNNFEMWAGGSGDCMATNGGYDFVNEDNNPDDANNNLHATQMAAILLNQLPPDTKIEMMNLKAFNEQGKGTLFDNICAMDYAVANGADIINLSWSHRGISSVIFENTLLRTQDNASQRPLVFVSAGNGVFSSNVNYNVGRNLEEFNFFPALFDFDNVVTVAAADEKLLARFSNFSKFQVEVAGPGIINSGIGGEPITFGTSGATAFVTGKAAAIWQHLRNLNENESQNPIIYTEVLEALQDAVIPMSADALEWKGKIDNLSLSVQTVAESCNGSGDGIAKAIVEGGCPPYTFEWDNGVTHPTLSNLSEGTYSVTVTDELGFQIAGTGTVEKCVFSFIVDDVCGQPGGDIQIPVYVQNYNAVSGFQFSVHIATTLAQINSVSDFGLTGWNETDFTINAETGTITVTRAATNGDIENGEAVADFAHAFNINVTLENVMDKMAVNYIDGYPTPVVAQRNNEATQPALIAGYLCIEGFAIEGNVRFFDVNDNGAPIEGVVMDIMGNQTHTTDTDIMGDYAFPDLNVGGNLTLTPSKISEPACGLDMNDVALAQSHALNQSLLGTPCQMVAADVNQDDIISMVDAYYIQQQSMNPSTQTLPMGQSWYFVPTDYQFPANPFMEDFPQIREYMPIDGRYLEEDFWGIKVGDVDGSANPNLRQEEDKEE